MLPFNSFVTDFIRRKRQPLEDLIKGSFGVPSLPKGIDIQVAPKPQYKATDWRVIKPPEQKPIFDNSIFKVRHLPQHILQAVRNVGNKEIDVAKAGARKVSDFTLHTGNTLLAARDKVG